LNSKNLWQFLIQSARLEALEIHTIPQTKSIPLWFRVEIQGDYLIIKNALFHVPSVKLSHDRKISFKDFEFVYGYYHRWIIGETGVRHEVSRKSRNTAYIFALIAEASKQTV
jgi:hypothetical protein